MRRVHVLALDELGEHLEAALALLDGLQVEVRRDDGQALERPLAAHGLDALGRDQFEQMADGRREDVLVALEVVVVLLETAQRLGDVAGDGRFLRNDQGLAHMNPRFLIRAGETRQLFF